MSSFQEFPYIVSTRNSYFYSSTELTFQYIYREGVFCLQKLFCYSILYFQPWSPPTHMVLLHTTQIATASVRPPCDYSSQDTRLEETSRIIWLSLSWKKHNLDKMAQDPLQLYHTSIQCWGIQQFHGKIIPSADCSYCEKISSHVPLEYPQE